MALFIDLEKIYIKQDPGKWKRNMKRKITVKKYGYRREGGRK